MICMLIQTCAYTPHCSSIQQTVQVSDVGDRINPQARLDGRLLDYHRSETLTMSHHWVTYYMYMYVVAVRQHLKSRLTNHWPAYY